MAVEPALKMGLLVVLLAWTAGVGLGLVLACASIVVAAWPPRRRWRCERLADCGYEQPLI